MLKKSAKEKYLLIIMEKDTMKAAFMDGINILNVRKTPIPKISLDDILLRVDSCGICGSDLRILANGYKRVPVPQIMGHEIAGTVVEVGKNQIEKYRIGDKIALAADIPCGSCHWCKNGLSNHCIDNIGFGHEYQGGFAEYLLLNKRILQYGPVVIIPNTEKTQNELALSEPLACCINGLDMCDMKKGYNVLILGAGPIGCMLAKLSKSLGANSIALCDVDKTRLDLAKITQSDCYVIFDKDALNDTKYYLTKGLGFDIVLIACPSINAQEAALPYVKNGGYLNFFGGLPEGTKPINLNSNEVHYRELRIVGSHGTTPRHHRIAVEKILNGEICISDMITDIYNLDNINDAFARIKEKQTMKIIINPYSNN